MGQTLNPNPNQAADARDGDFRGGDVPRGGANDGHDLWRTKPIDEISCSSKYSRRAAACGAASSRGRDTWRSCIGISASNRMSALVARTNGRTDGRTPAARPSPVHITPRFVYLLIYLLTSPVIFQSSVKPNDN